MFKKRNKLREVFQIVTIEPNGKESTVTIYGRSEDTYLRSRSLRQEIKEAKAEAKKFKMVGLTKLVVWM